MSNPAVTKLRETELGRIPVWLDDNIGESVHLHIDDIRVDFTIKEFRAFSNEVKDVINALVDVEGFDMHMIDPQYFEFMLWENISHLQEVRYDEVYLGEMLCPGNDGTLVKLPESRLVKALNGDTSENTAPRHSDHIGQTGAERLDDIKDSIGKNGYPFNDQYIIMYNDDNIIQDGQHRAACLYKEYGNVPVKVQRFVFDNYETRPAGKLFKYTFFGQIVTELSHPMAYLRKKIAYFRDRKEKRDKESRIKNYLRNNEDDHKKSLAILNNK